MGVDRCVALGPVKGHFATAGRCLVQCREQCSVCVCVCVCERERERGGVL